MKATIHVDRGGARLDTRHTSNDTTLAEQLRVKLMPVLVWLETRLRDSGRLSVDPKGGKP